MWQVLRLMQRTELQAMGHSDPSCANTRRLKNESRHPRVR